MMTVVARRTTSDLGGQRLRGLGVAMPRVATLAFVAALAAGCAGTSVRTAHYPSGQKRSEMQTRGRTPHGPSNTWHPNGVLASRGAFRNGRREGVWTFYDDRGELVRREAYRRGAVIWRTTDVSEQVPADVSAEMTRRDALPPEAPFTFTSVDHFDAFSRVGVAAGFHRIEAAPDTRGEVGSADGTRIELDGQLALGAWGAYGRLAGNAVAFESGDRASGLNGLDVGGYRLFETSAGTVAVRAGMLIPLGETNENLLSSALLVHERIGDFGTSFPNAWGLRLSSSLARSAGPVEIRADVGLDGLLSVRDSDQPGLRDDAEALGRVGVAAGIPWRSLMGSVELTNVAFLSEEGDLGARMLHTLTVALGHRRGYLHPGLSVALPLDAGARGEHWIVALSLQIVRLR